jgi:aspartate aminotransferase-like enzyme
MIRKTRLFTPGPTPLLPAAQFAMAAADIHHRTPEFRALFQKVLAQLKVFVGTRNDLLLLSCSGTGAMEASVSNLTSPGDRVLVLSAGKFGERWAELTKAFGCQVDLVEAPYGQTFDLADVRKALKPEHRAIFMQASETSTAVSHDVEAVAKLRSEVAPGTLLVVDGITGLGTTHFDVDGWGIDILIGGSQKAVMIPPGLAYLSVSDKAWAAMESSSSPRYYFDLRKERKNQGKAWARLWTTLPGRRVATWKRAASHSSTMRAPTPPPRVPAWWLSASPFLLPLPLRPRPRPWLCLRAWTPATWSRR